MINKFSKLDYEEYVRIKKRIADNNNRIKPELLRDGFSFHFSDDYVFLYLVLEWLENNTQASWNYTKPTKMDYAEKFLSFEYDTSLPNYPEILYSGTYSKDDLVFGELWE